MVLFKNWKKVGVQIGNATEWERIMASLILRLCQISVLESAFENYLPNSRFTFRLHLHKAKWPAVAVPVPNNP